jgi:hypothetical protein
MSHLGRVSLMSSGQHIYERHAITRRCQVCWLRISIKDDMEELERVATWGKNARPHSEVLIGPDQEGAVEEAFRYSPFLDTLWETSAGGAMYRRP